MTTIQTKVMGIPYDGGFKSHASQVLFEVRQSIAAACHHLGVDSTKPRLFARQMGWNKNLAWKVSRIVTGDDVLAAIPLLPGRAGQETILKSFAAAGVPAPFIEAIRSAFLEFEAMVLTHAGARDTFQKMLADLTDVGQADRDEAHRKLAFEGSSTLWGVETRARLVCNLISPNDADEMKLDCASIGGVIGFRRLRSDTSWTIASSGTISNTGKEYSPRSEYSLEPGAPDLMPPLISAFSAGVPPLCAVPGPGHLTLYRIMRGAIGNAGLFTSIFGLMQHGILQRWRDSDDDKHEFLVDINTPIEMLYFDLFVHKSLEYALNPTMSIFNVLPGEPTMGSNRNQMTPSEKILNIPTNPLDVTAPEIPNYPRMAKWFFERIGKNPADYRGFRFRQRYPLLSTRVAYQYNLSDRPA